jgi:hypothetical protein
VVAYKPELFKLSLGGSPWKIIQNYDAGNNLSKAKNSIAISRFFKKKQQLR